MEAWRLADLHAYVDDCLEPDERLAFETADGAGSRAGAPRRAVAGAKQRDSRGLRQRGRESLFDQHRSPPEREFGRARRPARGRRQTVFRRADATVIAHELSTPRDFRRRPLRPSAFRPSLYGGWGSRRCPSALPSFGRRPRPSSPPKDLERPALRLSRPSPARALSRSNSRPATGPKREAWLTTRLAHPVYSPRDSRRRQADRSADRALPRRPGGLSDLQIAGQACRIVDPVS